MIKILLSYIIYYVVGGVKSAKFQGVKIGQECRVYIKNFGSEPFLIEIGDNVTITAGTRFINHDGSLCLVKDSKGRRFKYGKIIIGNNVFIGVNTVILPGVTIGNNVVIGSGSIVTKSLSGNSVYVGNPAKKVSSFKDFISKYNNYPSEMDFKKLNKNENNIKKVCHLDE